MRVCAYAVNQSEALPAESEYNLMTSLDLAARRPRRAALDQPKTETRSDPLPTRLAKHRYFCAAD
jgi:hypothetical protein